MPIDKELKPYMYITMADTCPCSKLNNTEAKHTRVPPHSFIVVAVAVIVKPWASLFVIAVDIIRVYGLYFSIIVLLSK